MELLFGASLGPLARADWTDDQVAAALGVILGLDPARFPGAILQPLTAPDVVRDFVSSLTPAQLAALAAQHPELIGPVDEMAHRAWSRARSMRVRSPTPSPTSPSLGAMPRASTTR